MRATFLSPTLGQTGHPSNFRESGSSLAFPEHPLPSYPPCPLELSSQLSHQMAPSNLMDPGRPAQAGVSSMFPSFGLGFLLGHRPLPTSKTASHNDPAPVPYQDAALGSPWPVFASSSSAANGLYQPPPGLGHLPSSWTRSALWVSKRCLGLCHSPTSPSRCSMSPSPRLQIKLPQDHTLVTPAGRLCPISASAGRPVPHPYPQSTVSAEASEISEPHCRMVTVTSSTSSPTFLHGSFVLHPNTLGTLLPPGLCTPKHSSLPATSSVSLGVF